MSTQQGVSSNISLFGDADLPDLATFKGVVVDVRDLRHKLSRLWRDQCEDYTGDVCGVRVNRGYRFKRAYEEGKCCQNLAAIQGWKIPGEERHGDTVFLTPPVTCRPLFGKVVRDQIAWFRRMEEEYDLPAGALSFGTVQSVSAMMLAHLKVANERLAQRCYLRTDSRQYGDGEHLVLCWHDGELECGGWRFFDNPDPMVGGLVGVMLEL